MTILHHGHRRHSLLSPQRSRHTRMVVLVRFDDGETSPPALLVQHRLQQLPVAEGGPQPRRCRISNIFSGFTNTGSVGTILDTIFATILVLISNFRICFKILRFISLIVGDRIVQIQAIVRVSGGLRDGVSVAGGHHGQLQLRHEGGGGGLPGAEAGRHLKLGLRALLLPSAGAVPDNWSFKQGI